MIRPCRPPIFSRRTVVCFLAVAVALLAAGRANAGYGVGPDGQTFPVTASSAGFVQTPARSISSSIWTPRTARPPCGCRTARRSALRGYRWAATLAPAPPARSFLSARPTSGSAASRPLNCNPAARTTGGSASAPGSGHSGPDGSDLRPVQLLARAGGHAVASGSGTAARREGAARPVSTKTIVAAARLPGSTVFNGSRSVKHTTLTQLVYRTMKRLGYPRQLAFACWNRAGLALGPGGRRGLSRRSGQRDSSSASGYGQPAALAASGARNAAPTCKALI